MKRLKRIFLKDCILYGSTRDAIADIWKWHRPLIERCMNGKP